MALKLSPPENGWFNTSIANFAILMALKSGHPAAFWLEPAGSMKLLSLSLWLFVFGLLISDGAGV
jgi:hypothetical protein